MINKGLFTSNTNEWSTPQSLFDALDHEFNFDLDPCANEQNHKCDRYFTRADDGLKQNWGGVLRVLQPSVWSGNQRLGSESL